MREQALLFLLVFPLCLCQQQVQCPRWGQVRRADPNNDRRFLQCNDGRGRWFICAEGLEFVEDQQSCQTPRYSSRQTTSRSNSAPRQVASNSNTGSSTRGNTRSTGGGDWDYHW